MAISLSTALTILGSFAAASTAQVVSHLLTQKRDDKKHKKDCLQNLYSPIIFKFIDYINIIGTGHSPTWIFSNSPDFWESEKLFKQIMDHIGDNLVYANPDLINLYYEISNIDEKLKDPGIDLKGKPTEFIIEISRDTLSKRVEFANMVFTQYIELNNSLKSHSTSINEKLFPPYFASQLYLLMEECFYIEFYSELIFDLYDLIEPTLLPKNDYLERIKAIRNELNTAQNSYSYSNPNIYNQIINDSYLTAYHFLYEIVDEMSIFSETRTEELRDFLDTHIKDN